MLLFSANFYIENCFFFIISIFRLFEIYIFNQYLYIKNFFFLFFMITLGNLKKILGHLFYFTVTAFLGYEKYFSKYKLLF